jgi:phage shock protein PspC (stress-responsive transcriptional regulator)
MVFALTNQVTCSSYMNFLSLLRASPITFNGAENKILYMKRLYRSRSERVVAGVCAGIGEYADVDPTVIRLIWVVLTLLSLGVGLVAYIIAWIIVPEGQNEPGQNPEQPASGGSL